MGYVGTRDVFYLSSTSDLIIQNVSSILKVALNSNGSMGSGTNYTAETNQVMTDITCSSSSNGWIVGYFQGILHCSNIPSLGTWVKENTGTVGPSYAVSFADASVGFSAYAYNTQLTEERVGERQKISGRLFYLLMLTTHIVLLHPVRTDWLRITRFLKAPQNMQHQVQIPMSVLRSLVTVSACLQNQQQRILLRSPGHRTMFSEIRELM